MKIKDRFVDYWRTDIAFQDYTYDIGIIEELLYGIVGSIIGFVILIGGILTMPIWGIPYLIYKAISCKLT